MPPNSLGRELVQYIFPFAITIYVDVNAAQMTTLLFCLSSLNHIALVLLPLLMFNALRYRKTNNGIK
jgi:uncharacterized membrane protein YwaF